MPLSHRENYLRNATFSRPEWMPCTVSISGASWRQLGAELEEVLVRHPILFPRFEKGKQSLSESNPDLALEATLRFTDAWGCGWRCEIDGIEGIVDLHPLKDWSKLEGYKAPDPLIQADRGPADWEGARKRVAEARQRGDLVSGGTAHGFLFMRLYYLRGFENLMLDFATEPPELQQLISLLVEYNAKIVNEWLALGVDVMEFAEDLGTQSAAAIGPATFRKWITPAYQALMRPCKQAGTLVALHSDGYVLELMDEFIKAGVDIVNPQDLCNGIDNLAREVKGRMCVRLDIDRQSIVPYGTRKDIRDLIEEEVRKLGSAQGGLEMIAGIYPPTPAENVDALCSALEEFRTYWWNR